MHRNTRVPGTATGADRVAWRAAMAALDIIEAEIPDTDCRLEAAREVTRLLCGQILCRIQDES